MKWAGHRNLRLRPPAPAKGRGRLQRQVTRACIAAGTPIVYSSMFYAWAYAGKKLRGEPVSWGHSGYSKAQLPRHTMTNNFAMEGFPSRALTD